MGKTCFYNYRKYPDERLADYRQPPYIENSLRLTAKLLRYFATAEANEVSSWLLERFDRSVENS